MQTATLSVSGKWRGGYELDMVKDTPGSWFILDKLYSDHEWIAFDLSERVHVSKVNIKQRDATSMYTPLEIHIEHADNTSGPWTTVATIPHGNQLVEWSS